VFVVHLARRRTANNLHCYAPLAISAQQSQLLCRFEQNRSGPNLPYHWPNPTCRPNFPRPVPLKANPSTPTPNPTEPSPPPSSLRRRRNTPCVAAASPPSLFSLPHGPSAPPRPTSPPGASGGGGGGPSSRPRRQRHPPDRRRLELPTAGGPAPSRSTAASLLCAPPAPLPWAHSSLPLSRRSRVDEAVAGSSPRAGIRRGGHFPPWHLQAAGSAPPPPWLGGRTPATRARHSPRNPAHRRTAPAPASQILNRHSNYLKISQFSSYSLPSADRTIDYLKKY
jgi:hypothetical protein